MGAPTQAPPGSPEKVAVLEERARLRQSLWHPEDAPMDGRFVLAAVAEEVAGQPFARVLETGLWAKLAAHDAVLMLDRRRGQAAAHCCMWATSPDWLRAGLQLTQAEGLRNYRAAGRTLWVQPPDAAVLWKGAGEPPSALETLLAGVEGAGEETSSPQ